MSETPDRPTIPAVPSSPDVEVKIGMIPQARVVKVMAKRRLELNGIEFLLNFATIKSLAAQILAMEASHELREQAARSPIVRS